MECEGKQKERGLNTFRVQCFAFRVPRSVFRVPRYGVRDWVSAYY